MLLGLAWERGLYDMAPMIARIFSNGRNQAVRIPLELSLDAEAVTIERQGDALILRPLPSGGWGRFFAAPALAWPPDLELEEDDPPLQERPELKY